MTPLYKTLLDKFAVNGENTATWIAASKNCFRTFIHTDPILQRFSDNIIAEIKSNPYSLYGPEKENRISQELRSIRAKLVQKAKQAGIDELWLEKWWRYINRSREIVTEVRWSDK